MCVIYFDHSQGRFQDCFQGVAEISSAGGENLPGGGEKIARYPPSPQCFLFSYKTLLIYAHLTFDILDTWYKEIHKIYYFAFSCSSFIFYTQVRVPRDVLGSGVGSKSLDIVRGLRPTP